MNSKYAPIVALTVLVILVVAALSWFLAIKPRFDSASTFNQQSSEVDANTSQIKLESSKLTQYQQELEALAPLDSSLALNLPSTVDIASYRDRILAAVASSKVNLISLDLAASYPVDGWQLPPTSRASYSIAHLFAIAPVHTADEAASAPQPSPSPTADGAAPAVTGGYTAPVVPSTETGAVVTDMKGLPFTVSVTGTYPQTVAFLKALTPADEQLFLIYDVTQTARNEESAPLDGVPDAKDGDVIVDITGAFYFLNPDTSVVDDDALEPVKPSGTSPFAPSTGNKPSSN